MLSPYLSGRYISITNESPKGVTGFGFDESDLVSYATPLGLAVPWFVTELAEPTWDPMVREDFMTGGRRGVKGPHRAEAGRP